MKRKKQIRRVSKKRAAQNRKYSTNRIIYLLEHPICETADCNHSATDIHHMRGRSGEQLLDESDWLGTCRPCHSMIEMNPAWARAKGYTRSRLEWN